MDLLRQVEELTARAVEIQEGESDRRDMELYQGRAQKLAQPATLYSRLATEAQTMRAAGIPFSAPADIKALGYRATQVLAQFEGNPKSVLEPTDEIRFAFWDRLGEVALVTDRHLREGWEAHVVRSMPHIDAGLIDVLPTVSDADRRQIAEIQSEVRLLASSAPEDPKVIEKLALLAARLRRLLETIGVEGLPADVRTFVSAMARDSATLELVTPGVSAWLREHNLTGRIQLRFGGRPR